MSVEPGPEQADPLSKLTRRERQIALIAGTGVTTRLIARELFLSPRTVDAHLARIYRKLNVASRTGLAALVARG
jgi:DNA-binding CsgD family transcriptional regulator